MAAASQAGEMDRSAFLEQFSDLVARRDYVGALGICRTRLRVKPDDKYVLEMRQTLQHFLDEAEALDADGAEEGSEEPPELDELEEPAELATGRAFEAVYAYLEDEARLRALGEQAVQIFWDAGQVAPVGKQRARLLEMARTLASRLVLRLRAAGRPRPGQADHEMGLGPEWLLEALGCLWWLRELGLEREEPLVDECLEEWIASGGSMKTLVGFSLEELQAVPKRGLSEVLISAFTLERSVVCGLFGDDRPEPPPLEFGVQEVLAEVRRRQLTEPPLPGFFSDFCVMTQVVYVLNCFNGALPNKRSDCPWLYAYLERCLGFFMREARAQAPAATAGEWAEEAVSAVAEAVDCLRGLGGDLHGAGGRLVREGLAWLLGRQGPDGLFHPPAGALPNDSEYDYVRPSWAAAAALQLSREVPCSSPRCAAWSAFAHSAARAARLSEPPPLPLVGAPSDAEAPEEDEEEDDDDVDNTG